MKKMGIMILALVLAMTMLGAAAAEGVTLNVVTSYGGDDGNRANFEAAVASYEAATGNKVNDGSATSNEEWKAKVLTDFETGAEPDVLFYFTNADAEPFISKGQVVSIAEIREAYPDYAANMKDTMLAVAADGKNYAVPSSGFWENMFVNKKVLADCGVAVPGPDYTWDQFLADCAKIKEAGYTPIACSLFEVPHYWFEFLVMNHGTLENHLDLPKLENGELVKDATAEKWIAALEDMKTLYELGYFPANTLTAQDAETVEMFGLFHRQRREPGRLRHCLRARPGRPEGQRSHRRHLHGLFHHPEGLGERSHPGRGGEVRFPSDLRRSAEHRRDH